MINCRFTSLAADKILDSLFSGRQHKYALINMITATSSFDVSQYIELDVNSLLQGIDHYSDPHGLLELRGGLVKSYQKNFGVDIDAGRIFITDGAMGALTLVFARLLKPGDEVIVPAAAFPGYQTLAEVFHGHLISCPLNVDGSFDREALESKINTKTRFINSSFGVQNLSFRVISLMA